MACVIAAFIWLYMPWAMFDAVYCGRRFGLCFESLGRVAAIEAYPPRAGLYDYYGTGFVDIAVVSTDYRAYVIEPV